MVLRPGLLVLGSVFLLSICPCAFGIAEPAPPQAQTSTLTVSEYVAELDGLASTARQLVHPEDAPRLLNSIPPGWRIQTPQQIFEVSSEWLRQELNDWQKKPSREIQDRIVARLQSLRSEAASFQGSPKDVSQKRVLLNGILAARELPKIHGTTWLDRFKQRLVELLIKLLGRVFQSSAIPTIGNAVVYGLMALALLAVAYWMYRTIRSNAGVEAIAPLSLSVSSKGWKLWMREARLAAESGNWPDAIHLGYWCGISFLEAQELWRPETAPTPPGYLRLLPRAREHRQTLCGLTRTFAF